MFLHPVYMMFFMIMILSTLLMMSTNSWLMTWVIIEINMLVFIPLINMKKSKYQSESALKYFITQATASVLIILSLFSLFNFNNMTSSILTMALMLKMGVAPLHQWMPAICEGLTWEVMLILMIPQKVGPLILIYQTLMPKHSNYKLSLFILLTTLVGSIGGLINFSLRKIMIYSSITHAGWMLTAIMINLNLWISYFIIYMLISVSIVMNFNNMKINTLKQMFFINNSVLKYTMMIMFLSIAGLPPFSGFLAKYLVILSMSFSTNKILVLPLILTTLMSLFFYTRIILMNMFSINSKFYLPLNPKDNNNKIIMMNMIALSGGWVMFM
uniref:NADH-ubiquinone oxidoreductase chain 2 n=1 Tax=Pleonexes koreana TaxID=2663336 RepID=A0A5P9W8G4_9CRUS|nr:NADH dehydrogenase subunit 2 [Pleonexes koreana]